MRMLKLLLLPTRVTLPGVGVGILSSMAMRRYGRPLLVDTVRGTMRLWNEAKEQTDDVRAEARIGLATAPRTTTTRVD